jgi:hypothetical protein
MSELTDRSLEAHWRAFAKRIELPTMRVTKIDDYGEEAIFVEFDLGHMTATFDSQEQREEFMSRYNLRVLEILNGGGTGQCIVGWFQ